MRKLTVFATGLACVVAAPMAYGVGIPAKAKAGKVQGNLVQSYHPTDTGPGTGDDENDSAALNDAAVQSSACTFESGKFKSQVGKDTSVSLKGVKCGGTPFTGALCAHTKVLSTIMTEDIDKAGASTPKTCPVPVVLNAAGLVNYVSGNVGSLACTAGACSGTLPNVATDPCPDVDKVTELRRLEVFDGNDSLSGTVLGTTLKVCCGPTQTIAGGIPAAGAAPCNTSTQKVLAEMGTVVQGEVP